MNSKINYYLDDLAQIYFSPLDNLDYELIQAERSFGFNDKTFANLTTAEIDGALNTKKQIPDRVKNDILNALNLDSTITKFDVTCDGQVINGSGFGFKDFAIMFHQNYLWLLIRQDIKEQVEIMAEIIEKISNEFALFLVDKEQNFVIDSRVKSEFIFYLKTES
jgi:hypothetical protein